MLKTLLKKQYLELCRSFYMDPKKGTARSRQGTVWVMIGYFVLFAVVLGGGLAAIGALLASPLSESGNGWLYFAIVSLIALIMGVVGSVFSTFSSLYGAKDNDLLLSLPIPIPLIFLTRLSGVYLMGLVFTAVGMLPMMAVWWIVDGFSVGAVFGGLWLMLLLSLIVLVLSCALGWVVAKIRVRVKRKSLIAVLSALIVIGAYYWVYFRAVEALKDLALNAWQLGTKLRVSSPLIYRIGLAGTGDWRSLLVMTALSVLLAFLTYRLLSHSFLKLATASAGGKKTDAGRVQAVRSVNRALLSREFSRYLSSPTYMLNASLGVLILPVGAAMLLWKREMLRTLLYQVFGAEPGMIPVLGAAALCLAGSMNLMTSSSVSLEGKHIWIAQSLPVSAEKVLWSKAKLHLWLSLPPMALCSVCLALVCAGTVAEGSFIVLFSLVCTVFSALVGLALNLKYPVLTWTNETTAVKQGVAVLLAILPGWVGAPALAGIYYLLGGAIPATWYLAAVTVPITAGCALLIKWLRTRGSEIFAGL